MGDALVRSILSWAGRGLRGLVPSRRPFPSPQRCRAERAEPQPSIRLRVASGQGLAAGVGRRVVLVLEGVLPAAGIQHPVAVQRGARIDPLRDSRLAVCARQASRHQRLVDGARHDRSPRLERTGPDLRGQFRDRHLLNPAKPEAPACGADTQALPELRPCEPAHERVANACQHRADVVAHERRKHGHGSLILGRHKLRIDD